MKRKKRLFFDFQTGRPKQSSKTAVADSGTEDDGASQPEAHMQTTDDSASQSDGAEAHEDESAVAEPVIIGDSRGRSSGSISGSSGRHARHRAPCLTPNDHF